MSETTVEQLVSLLLHTRKELWRALDGLSDAEAERPLERTNPISWTVGHLAHQEDRLWKVLCQHQPQDEWLATNFGFGSPPSSPPFSQVKAALGQTQQDTEAYLRSLTPTEASRVPTDPQGRSFRNETVLQLVQRVIAHQWLHIGEVCVIRTLLGNHAGNFPGELAEPRQQASG